MDVSYYVKCLNWSIKVICLSWADFTFFVILSLLKKKKKLHVVVFCPSLNYKEEKLYKLGRLICAYLVSLNGQLANRQVKLCCFHWLHTFQWFLHEVQTHVWVCKWDLSRLNKQVRWRVAGIASLYELAF